jgi:hypothetical protein
VEASGHEEYLLKLFEEEIRKQTFLLTKTKLPKVNEKLFD